MFGASSYEQVKIGHRGWVEEYLGDGDKGGQDEWAGSIAVGSRSFVEAVKSLLGFRAKGREAMEADEGYQLREEAAHYKAFSRAEKSDIGPENTYLWEVEMKQSITCHDPR